MAKLACNVMQAGGTFLGDRLLIYIFKYQNQNVCVNESSDFKIKSD